MSFLIGFLTIIVVSLIKLHTAHNILLVVILLAFFYISVHLLLYMHPFFSFEYE
jgi:hypothetical protein